MEAEIGFFELFQQLRELNFNKSMLTVSFESSQCNSTAVFSEGGREKIISAICDFPVQNVAWLVRNNGIVDWNQGIPS